MTMIEVMVAATVFTVTAGGISAVMTSTFSLGRVNRERAMAMSAAEGVIEAMKAAPFREVFARYNADPADDPVGPVPGNTFDVRGLRPQPGDPDGAVGGVIFPGGVFSLREDAVNRQLGTPRDLNGDGVVDGSDHGTTYVVLPVAVRVAWTGAGGAQELTLVTTLASN